MNRWKECRALPALVLSLAAALMLGCERPPTDVEQTGYRGTGLQEVENPRIRAANRAAHEAPEPLDAVSAEGPRAGQIYQNVEVLGDLRIAEFQRVMQAMTQWVAPEQSCNYCHVPGNFAAEDKYTKVVSRRMIQMTRHINANWTEHVADTGVTCYTCHRGQNVPAEIWFHEPVDDMFTEAGNRYMQNKPVAKTGYSSLPRDALSRYLVGDRGIRVQAEQALPSDHVASIQHTEATYSLMMHMSDSLGVTCQVCHNSRAFGSWEQSPPPRATAWHGIRMARELNNDYLIPLTDVFPANRLGPEGDVAKVSCATCHQGVQKPLYGAKMVVDYPALIGDAPAAGDGDAAASEPDG